MKNTKSMNYGLLAATVVAAVVFTGCTPSKPKQGLISLAEDSQKIVSTRPQMLNTHMMVILKLKTPALLNYSEKENGKTVVHSVYLNQVKKEQESVLAELKKISSDIQVVYKYKYVLNAVCIIVPNALIDQVAKLGQVSTWENVGVFSRPENIQTLKVSAKDASITERNSSKFIGAEKLNQLGITGQGIKVGVLDTGIDYTHSMLGGIGTQEAYKAVNPSEPALGYPNKKVVGGIDLVGTHYDGGSPDFRLRLPKPDTNPIDEAGHGTHVAGTVAGLGDGINSYNGMAPEADLYSIKVFGADGSTSDMVVIAGLEFAVDPNGDDDLGDQLDVVNLSLGSSYGNPKLLYSEAVKNLAKGGTVSIISAGNSGDNDYIVGAPGTSTEALSVAASIDDGFHNWNFAAVEISINGEKIVTEAFEASGTKPIAETEVSGDLVPAGLADKDFSEEMKQKLAGKIALIDRGGGITFNDKIARAVSAGAIGVVIANNQEGAAFRMPTEKQPIPAVMITKDLGAKAKAAIAQNQTAQIQFKSDEKIQKPELIDSITGFSSKGPRSMDGFLKPEISAPGSDIISAAMGEGSGIVQLSGTSMAAPHMAGVMALIKQSFKKREIEMSALDLKHVAMGTAKTIGFTVDGKYERYPLTRQGSGRIQADIAANADIVANLPSISFGEINIETKKTMAEALQLRNLGNKDKSLSIEFVGNRFIQMKNSHSIVLKANSKAELKLNFILDSTGMKEAQVREMDGWVLIKENNLEIYRVPVLAVANTLSAIKADELKIESSKMDAEGSVANLKLSNASVNAGEVLLFNHLGSDIRKPLASNFMSSDCDLQSVGYRIVDREVEDGKNQKMIQFAVKVYKPATTWNSCDISILIDQDKDGNYEQELLGAVGATIPGVNDGNHMSILIDATKARALRKSYEEKILAAKGDPEQVAKLKDKESYSEALLAMNGSMNYNNSTVVVVEAPVAMIKVNEKNEINFQVVVTHNEQNSTETDDYLSLGKAANSAKWLTISANEADQSYLNLGQKIEVPGQQKQDISLTKGRGNQSLMLLAPQNKFSFSDSLVDAQLGVIKPSYGN